MGKLTPILIVTQMVTHTGRWRNRRLVLLTGWSTGSVWNAVTDMSCLVFECCFADTGVITTAHHASEIILLDMDILFYSVDNHKNTQGDVRIFARMCWIYISIHLYPFLIKVVSYSMGWPKYLIIKSTRSVITLIQNHWWVSTNTYLSAQSALYQLI